MNKLPESYIVNCNLNIKYCREVYSNFYNDDFIPYDWRYIICSPLIKQAQFESTGKYSSENCINNVIYSLDGELQSLPVFTYEEWKKLKDYKFPEKWCIKVTEDNIKVIGGYYDREGADTYTKKSRIGSYYTSHNLSSGVSIMSTDFDANFIIHAPTEEYPEITFKEFEENVLNKLGIKVEKMEKEIIGYKLKEACWKYKDSAEQIAVNCSCDFDKMFKTNVTAVKLWREAGVLDLWFEPIYKEEEFKVGDWVYAEKSASSDYRCEEGDKYIPIFQIKEVAIFSSKAWLRPVKGACTGIISTLCRKATPDEIKQYERDALLAEANKRFPIGSKVRCRLEGFDATFIRKEPLYFFDDGITAYGEPWLYYDGKWAEVIVDTTPNITINGYKAKFLEGDIVKFGCQKYTADFVIKLSECLETNNFKMDYKDDILKIAEYYRNK